MPPSYGAASYAELLDKLQKYAGPYEKELQKLNAGASAVQKKLDGEWASKKAGWLSQLTANEFPGDQAEFPGDVDEELVGIAVHQAVALLENMGWGFSVLIKFGLVGLILWILLAERFAHILLIIWLQPGAVVKLQVNKTKFPYAKEKDLPEGKAFHCDDDDVALVENGATVLPIQVHTTPLRDALMKKFVGPGLPDIGLTATQVAGEAIFRRTSLEFKSAFAQMWYAMAFGKGFASKMTQAKLPAGASPAAVLASTNGTIVPPSGVSTGVPGLTQPRKPWLGFFLGPQAYPLAGKIKWESEWSTKGDLSASGAMTPVGAGDTTPPTGIDMALSLKEIQKFFGNWDEYLTKGLLGLPGSKPQEADAKEVSDCSGLLDLATMLVKDKALRGLVIEVAPPGVWQLPKDLQATKGYFDMATTFVGDKGETVSFAQGLRGYGAWIKAWREAVKASSELGNAEIEIIFRIGSEMNLDDGDHPGAPTPAHYRAFYKSVVDAILEGAGETLSARTLKFAMVANVTTIAGSAQPVLLTTSVMTGYLPTDPAYFPDFVGVDGYNTHSDVFDVIEAAGVAFFATYDAAVKAMTRQPHLLMPEFGATLFHTADWQKDPNWNKAPGWWLHAFYSGIRALLLDIASLCGYCPRAVLMYFAVNKTKDPYEQTDPAYIKNWALTQDRLDVPPTVFPATDKSKSPVQTYPVADEDMTPDGALQRYAAGVQGTDWIEDRDVVKQAKFLSAAPGQPIASAWKASGPVGCVAKWRAHFTAKPLPKVP